MVRKPDKSYRLCLDFRPLNGVILNKDAYPIPNPDQSLRSIKNAKFICVQDCVAGYHQIKMSECSKAKTAFCTPSGLYEFNVLPFGLVSAPGCFQRMVNELFAEMMYECVICYLDDIILFESSVARTLERLEKLFGILKSANLKLKPKKYYQKTQLHN